MSEEQATKELEMMVDKISKSQFKNNKTGDMQDKWDIIGPQDENGYDRSFTCFSATLVEEVKEGEVNKFLLRQNRGGYWQVANVTKQGAEFPKRESQSRYTKNYEQINRAAGVTAALELVKLNYAPAAEWKTVATSVAEFISSGK